MGKYDPLGTYLARQPEREVRVTFAEVEAVLGFQLPASARTHRPWWSNAGTGHIQAQAWIRAGFRTESVDLGGERVVFVRIASPGVLSVGEEPSGSIAMRGPRTERGRPRHPIVGAMRGTITVMPGVDLTAPADPEWVDRLNAENATANDLVGGLDEDK